MCYAIPGKVVSLDKKFATVEYFGELRQVWREHSKVEVGDYVYAQGGIIVDRIKDKEEAVKLLEEWKEAFFKLKKLDQKLSEKIKNEKINSEIRKILEKDEKGIALNGKEIRLLLENENDIKSITEYSNRVRSKKLKNSCCVHGIIEFSNYCKQDCLYCGLRKENDSLKRYRMSTEEITNHAEYLVKELGFRALVLQSGEDYSYSDEELVKIIKKIKKKCGILLFVSVGERSKECYEKMYEAGARAALLRFETSNAEIYRKVRPGRELKDRIDLIKKLKEIGYLVATGFLVGLPGESTQDIINNILLTKSLKPEMYSFGPVIPHEETPLREIKLIDKNKILKTIALCRILDQESKILITTAMETLDKGLRKDGLLAGGNSLMINTTPEKYKRLYEIYPNKAGNELELKQDIDRTLELLYSIGRAPTDLGI